MGSDIVYTFIFLDGKSFSIRVSPGRVWPGESNGPEWARLSHCKCTNCPLNKDTSYYCPAAFDLSQIIHHFDNRNSFDECTIEVIDDQRKYQKSTSIQEGLSSLLGLLMTSSCCPHLAKLHRLSNRHIPFISLQESVQNLTGAFLIRQYLANKSHSGKRDMEVIHALFKEVHQVNIGLYKRLKDSIHSDAIRNAMNQFVAFSELMQSNFDSLLKESSPASEDLSTTHLPNE